MQESWRWFGPEDLVSLTDVAQAGARGIVTALHHRSPGEVWPLAEIERRQALISAGAPQTDPAIRWTVVESLPVSEDIKRQSGDWRTHVENYKTSLDNIAAAGIQVICYNFMPLLDWTRTDLAHTVDTGATCMRFDLPDFVMFDCFILKRAGAEAEYDEALVEEAKRRFKDTDDGFKARLIDNVICGLPGAASHLSLDDIKAHLEIYKSCDHRQMVQNQADFLEQVIPHAERLGLRMCCHPDDPPVALLGLPRIMSTEPDFHRLIDAVDLPANGITLCSGSLGARADNDLPGMMERLGDRVHFLHLRNVRREHDDMFGSFHESEHLDGDLPMAALVAAILKEERRRREAGRDDHSIPFRPDHGQDILDDLTRKAQPGYPAIGRLKGLAELRGLISGLEHAAANG
ncbi:mannonate dehydratase [uncultured Hoeflea sp.]|uniref:mannonate dehydratase n=1 Tax=uncultured Hoeflea sp. TaxID=538666 RepID=UPI00260E16D4|nr:mannonate dehydratase [uncultured Hoeflea sp.]